MFDLNAFEKISPIDPDKPDRIYSPEEFLKKAKKFLPNFPNDVIDQWVYDNFQIFCMQYELEFDRLRFFSEAMDLSEVLKIHDPSLYFERGIGYAVVDGSLDGLSSSGVIPYMRNHPTWPRPIIVLDVNESDMEGLRRCEYPYLLLEGHLRLACLLHKIDAGQKVNSEHKVWRVIRK